MKRILATFLAIVMCLGSISAFAAGKEFTDVKASDWFYNDVKTAVELGLVNGKSETTYAPNDKLTYAEAIKLAACMHQLYTVGKISFGTGDPWYTPYAEYCQKNKIIYKEYNYSENATRAGYMEIFAKALPGDGLKAINSVADDSIPDVPSSKDYAEGVYVLYRAGILQGVDAEHNCSPLNNITRAEVAAILTRMMNPEKRVKFTLGEEEKVEPMVFTKNPIGGALEVGGTIAVSVEVDGGVAPLKYKWEYNDGSDWKDVTKELGTVTGADAKRLSIKATESGNYKVRCVVTDAKGTEAISEETEFTFNPKFGFKRQPEDMTIIVGKPLSAKVEVEGGTPPYEYQWVCDVDGVWYSLINAANTGGADTAEMVYGPKVPNTTVVSCIVTDALGKKIQSKSATLVATAAPEAEKEEKKEEKVEEVKPDPFELVRGPKDVAIGLGETAEFEVEVKGGVAPYSYQWYFECNGWNKVQDKYTTGLEGETTEKMTLTANEAEVVKVRCVVLDAKGTKITTSAATLTVEDKDALTLVAGPETTTVKIGEDAKLSVETKGGSDKITYQWQWDMSEKGGWIKMSENDVWIGTETPELTVKSSIAANLLIRCVITDTERNVRIETEGVRAIFE